MQTIPEIAKTQGVSAAAVHKWLKKAVDKYGPIEPTVSDVDKRRREYSPEQVSKILEFQAIQPRTVQLEPDDTPVYKPVVIVGNHRQVEQSATVPQQFDLAQFRSQSSTAVDLSNTVNAIQAIRAIRQGLRSDIDQQWAQLEATQEAEAVLSEELAALERDADKYQVTSDILARLQSQSAKGVQGKLGKLSALGASEDSRSQQ